VRLGRAGPSLGCLRIETSPPLVPRRRPAPPGGGRAERCGTVISIAVKEIRAHERKRVLWNATLHQNGCIWECKAIEISPGGVRIRIDERLTINSKVVLTIERLGNFPGEVRWQDEDFAGIGFLEGAGVVQARLRGSVAAHHATWQGSPS
jgi:hypothetical protein